MLQCDHPPLGFSDHNPSPTSLTLSPVRVRHMKRTSLLCIQCFSIYIPSCPTRGINSNKRTHPLITTLEKPKALYGSACDLLHIAPKRVGARVVTLTGCEDPCGDSGKRRMEPEGGKGRKGGEEGDAL
eukprot:746755-Hanusia_phi.AAC.2